MRVQNRLCEQARVDTEWDTEWDTMFRANAAQLAVLSCAAQLAVLSCAALHTCMRSCTHTAKITPWRATVLAACELLRIRRLRRVAGTILCVDMCGCVCAMRRRGRCCTAWLHVRGERCSVHMETFSAAASAPGSGPMCKLAAFIFAHQAGQPPTAVIYTQLKNCPGQSQQLVR